MNILDYAKLKVKKLSAEECAWKLFKLTGQINYYMLYSALTSPEKEKNWTSSESKEL